jgi:acetylornithine/N-succinyldiaminopimelate aminotransferase
MSEKLTARLKALQRRNIGGIEEVRGKGLLIGVKFHANNGEVVNKLREAGMLTVAAAQNVVRLLPPLTIDESHIDECMGILERVAEKLTS